MHLTIRIKKKNDGSSALSCQRADGSVTWQSYGGQQGRFFPLHDLTHFAVETVLGHRRGFFGLVADGWDLDDFGTPWPRGPIPADADPSELIVGFLDTERATSETWSAAEFNDKAARHGQRTGQPVAFILQDTQLEAIRSRIRDLFHAWASLPPGETLELNFPL